jgi:hypothetical protein
MNLVVEKLAESSRNGGLHWCGDGTQLRRKIKTGSRHQAGRFEGIESAMILLTYKAPISNVGECKGMSLDERILVFWNSAIQPNRLQRHLPVDSKRP